MKTPWSPFHDVESLLDQLSMFDSAGSRSMGLSAGDISVDVAEFDDTVEITADVPGFDEDDITIDVRNDALSIRAERTSERHPQPDESATYVHRERHHTTTATQRTISLPADVAVEDATAQYTNGVLTISLPKVDPDESSGHTIDIE